MHNFLKPLKIPDKMFFLKTRKIQDHFKVPNK